MDSLFRPLASLLAFLYDLTHSYGLSIMALTLLVMIVTTPLTLKGTRSMLQMQKLQPEMRKLQVKYKDDRVQLNQEMQAFYKEHGINPVGGCFPLLLQAPVFMLLYQVLIGLTTHHRYGKQLGQAAGLFLREPSSGGTLANFGAFDPKHLDHATALYKDLSVSRSMPFLGLDLADTFSQRFSEGFVQAAPYAALVAFVAVTSWYQQRQIMARNASTKTEVPAQQQQIMKIMPFFLPLFSLALPAGLVLYFVVSNLYRIGQQAFITRTMYGDAVATGKSSANMPKLKETVPTGSKALFGGLIHLPDRSNGSAGKESTKPAAKNGSSKQAASKSNSGNGGGARPSRAAVAGGATSNANRSKKKKKRR